MEKVTLLKSRLKAIGHTLSHNTYALGLLGLGSAGNEIDRMDEYSDLDFFVIVKEGAKQQFIQDLSWLSQVQSIAWCFLNTPDGYKLLFSDGVFCEFAVFEVPELRFIPYSEGRFIWKHDALNEDLKKPTVAPPSECDDKAYLLAELLTNLYVGLGRYRRGEKLSAMRFIQIYAVDRLISLLDLESNNRVSKDPFCLDRRVEQRHSAHEKLLTACCQGAQNSAISAGVMLDFVVENYNVDSALEHEIRLLI